MSDWDLEVKPHLTPYFAYSAAFVIAAAHIAVGFALKIGSSGVIFQTADQVAMALLGVIIGALVLLFARPRLRVGADTRASCRSRAGLSRGGRNDEALCYFMYEENIDNYGPGSLGPELSGEADPPGRVVSSGRTVGEGRPS